MTENEKKELELFNKWWTDSKYEGQWEAVDYAEQAWFARANLDKDKDKFAPLNTFGYMDNTE